MYKRNLRAAEVVGDLAFPPGPAGVAFKINSVSKSEERYRREEREDVRKEGKTSRQPKERGEYGREEKIDGGRLSQSRERETVYQLPCALTRCKYNNKHVIK